MSPVTADAEPDSYEYEPVRIPPGTDRGTAAVQLSLQAEYGGWGRGTVRRGPPPPPPPPPPPLPVPPPPLGLSSARGSPRARSPPRPPGAPWGAHSPPA